MGPLSCYSSSTKRLTMMKMMLIRKEKKEKKNDFFLFSLFSFQCRPSEYWTPCIDVPAGVPLTRGGSDRDGSGIPCIPGIAGAAYCGGGGG